MATRTTDGRAAQDLVRWRRDQLSTSGFPLPLAAQLAKDPHYDLHALIELVERGCPPDLALTILAPLDEPWETPA